MFVKRLGGSSKLPNPVSSDSTLDELCFLTNKKQDWGAGVGAGYFWFLGAGAA